MSQPMLSFCTVAMNRRSHIEETLPVNLAQNRSKSIQFVLLDYNSQDGLDQYIKENFREQIIDGSLVYYKYTSASRFHRSHSRNMAFHLATGDIVCNLDADNFAGEGFGKYVQDLMDHKKNLCLTGLENQWRHDASGKLCVSKSNFLEVTGYDENFAGYGFEDYDIVNRLQMHGCETFTINKEEFLHAISHDDLDRLCNEEFCQKVRDVYVHFIDESTSKLLYLLNDGQFISATVINAYTIESRKPRPAIGKTSSISSQFYIKKGWKKGEWVIENDRLHLSGTQCMEVCDIQVKNSQCSFRSDTHEYFQVTLPAMKLDAISFYTQLINRKIMLGNLSNKNIRVNKVFGNGTVYKNFQHKPIEISNL